jgi:hypothetical protein
MRSAISNLLHAQKMGKLMDGKRDFIKFLEGLQKSLKYFLIGRLQQ